MLNDENFSKCCRHFFFFKRSNHFIEFNILYHLVVNKQMLRRISSASSSSVFLSSSCDVLLPVSLLLTSKNFKSKKITYANCTKYEAYAARQHGFASRLEVAAPLVAREWDYNKNPTKYFPSTLSCSSLQPFWWKCGECGWSYQMSPERRTIRGQGCPRCAGVEIVEEETTIFDKMFKETINYFSFYFFNNYPKDGTSV